MFESSRLLCGAACALVTGLLTTSRAANRSPTGPARGTSQIAFASHRDGNWEIYLTDVDGGHQTRITNRVAQDRFPLWSPDKSQIAFGSQIGGDHWELWVMNAKGTNPRPLATQIIPKGIRQWSHDGTRIAFAAKVQGDAEIFSVDVASGQVTRLTNSPGEDADPSWSPDDSHIVFSSARTGLPQIYLIRADGTQLRRLAQDLASDTRPAWSPDATRVAFLSKRDDDRDVYVVGSDDGRVERLTFGAHATNDALRWSRNGSYIAVQTAERDDYNIQVVRISDHERWTVAGTPAFDGQYSWSPAGDQLTFISGRDGFDALYVTDLAGKQNRLTATPSLNPEWSP